MSRDRASAVARAVVNSFAEHVRDDSALYLRIVDYLRDEFADIERKVLTEIRLHETDTEPSPLTSTPRKGGGHEHEDR
jgi:hypothetical protein